MLRENIINGCIIYVLIIFTLILNVYNDSIWYIIIILFVQCQIRPHAITTIGSALWLAVPWNWVHKDLWQMCKPSQHDT